MLPSTLLLLGHKDFYNLYYYYYCCYFVCMQWHAMELEDNFWELVLSIYLDVGSNSGRHVVKQVLYLLSHLTGFIMIFSDGILSSTQEWVSK